MDRELDRVDAGSRPYFVFVEHGENSVKLTIADDPQQYVIVDKQALGELAAAFTRLAHRFTIRGVERD